MSWRSHLQPWSLLHLQAKQRVACKHAKVMSRVLHPDNTAHEIDPANPEEG